MSQDQERTTRVIQTYSQPVEVELSRSAKGGYYWKISVRSESASATVAQIAEIDSQLRQKFSPETPTNSITKQQGGENQP